MQYNLELFRKCIFFFLNETQNGFLRLSKKKKLLKFRLIFRIGGGLGSYTSFWKSYEGIQDYILTTTISEFCLLNL